jgi:hypothetical protein
MKRDCTEKLDINGRIILKLILLKWGFAMWIEFNWLWITSGDALL